MTTATTASELKKLTRKELEALATPEASAEIERRKKNKQSRGKAYGERADGEVERALSDVLDMFASGKLPEAVAQTIIARQAGDLPVHDWSLLNQIIVMLSGTADARGTRQWKLAGREVNKGARPIFILGPKIRRYKVEDETTGEEVSRQVMQGFVGIPVYSIEDTEGDPVPPPPDYTPLALPPLFDVAKTLGVNVKWSHFTRDYYGYYSPGLEEIVLCTTDERTFFHELAHAAHQRVLEAKGRKLKGGQHASQEIVAETCAAVLCRLFNLDGYIYHGAQYIAGYAEKAGSDTRKSVAKVLSEVQETLALIMGTASGSKAKTKADSA